MEHWIIRLLILDLLPRRLLFLLVVNKVTLTQLFSPVSIIAPLAHTHCQLILLFSETQKSKACKPSNKAMLCEIMGSSEQKSILVLFLKNLKFMQIIRKCLVPASQ